MATLWKCVAEPSGNPPGQPHAARMPHTHTTHAAKTPLASDKIDAPAACAVPFRPYCGDVVTRTRNVGEYMLVLALCLVGIGAVREAMLSYYSFVAEWLRTSNGMGDRLRAGKPPQYFIKPPRSSHPPIFSDTSTEHQPTCDNIRWLRSKGRMAHSTYKRVR